MEECRQLRKRRLDLNGLASSVTRPLVCQVQFCGIKLKDERALDWHYEGHLNQELARLDKVCFILRHIFNSLIFQILIRPVNH